MGQERTHPHTSTMYKEVHCFLRWACPQWKKRVCPLLSLAMSDHGAIDRVIACPGRSTGTGSVKSWRRSDARKDLGAFFGYWRFSNQKMHLDPVICFNHRWDQEQIPSIWE